MTRKATDAALSDMHKALAVALTKRILSGEATAAEMSVAAKFLKDNNITAEAVPNSPLGNLVDSLPYFDDEGEACH